MPPPPFHPDYGLSPQAPLDITRYLTPGAGSYGMPPAPNDDPLDELLRMRSQGLEDLVCRVGDLIEARQQAGRESAAAISRDLTYLENLIIDRYRLNERATDDRTYVKLRLEQLRLHSEARQETVSCWRDTVLLAKELGDLVRRANEAQQRDRLLQGEIR
ncbi:MAG: hypothetical protein M0000_01615 [Actinomycetota bacterium]|nr:hypothetical protein [Actinomycetota bacterium]